MSDGHDDQHGDAKDADEDDEHGDAIDVDDDDEHGGVEAAFQNYKTDCWETQLAAIFLFNADGCGWLPST